MDNSHNNTSNNNNNNNNNNSHSSGEDSLCSSELKSSSNSSQHQQQRTKLHSPHRQRAMSFLHSISKRLGRRGGPKDLIYNSQDDIRSSSTDSFSLSLERGSGDEKQILSSNIDLTSDGHSSRSSSGSGSSHASSSGSGSDENNRDVTGCSYKQHKHSYEPICYRSVSALGKHDVADDGDDGDDDDSDKDDGDDNNQHEHDAAKATVYKFCARTPLRGLNLNRISISTVSRVLQHISSSSSSSSTSVSTRSLSCNSTPLKCAKQQQQSKKNDKKPASSVKSEPKKAAKPQPQQQRILRQPINYVYLKGMSGLPTRRVPRSSLCCSYGYR